jgi:hypothetical protein
MQCRTSSGSYAWRLLTDRLLPARGWRRAPSCPLELQDALERLLTDGRQVKRDASGTPYLLDPLFAEWLRRR